MRMEEQQTITISVQEYELLKRIVDLAEKQKEQLEKLTTPAEGMDMDRLKSLVDTVEVIEAITEVNDGIRAWEDEE